MQTESQGRKVLPLHESLLCQKNNIKHILSTILLIQPMQRTRFKYPEREIYQIHMTVNHRIIQASFIWLQGTNSQAVLGESNLPSFFLLQKS